MDEELISGAQAAEYLGVSRARIYALTRAGKIGRQIGGYWLYSRAELDAWKAKRSPKGGRPKDELKPTMKYQTPSSGAVLGSS